MGLLKETVRGYHRDPVPPFPSKNQGGEPTTVAFVTMLRIRLWVHGCKIMLGIVWRIL